MLRRIAKNALYAMSSLAVSPLVISELLCRSIARGDVFFRGQAQLLSLVPGSLGSYLRTAYYHFTLRHCPFSVVISFGSFFTHSEASIGERAYIGSRCMLGMVNIGERTMLADAIYVLSGKNQHGTTAGIDYQEQEGTFSAVTIGRNCWIGTNSVVMADIGNNAIIGAGSVVAKPIPADSKAVGNPARVLGAVESGAPASV